MPVGRARCAPHTALSVACAIRSPQPVPPHGPLPPVVRACALTTDTDVGARISEAAVLNPVTGSAKAGDAARWRSRSRAVRHNHHGAPGGAPGRGGCGGSGPNRSRPPLLPRRSAGLAGVAFAVPLRRVRLSRSLRIRENQRLCYKMRLRPASRGYEGWQARPQDRPLVDSGLSRAQNRPLPGPVRARPDCGRWRWSKLGRRGEAGEPGSAGGIDLDGAAEGPLSNILRRSNDCANPLTTVGGPT